MPHDAANAAVLFVAVAVVAVPIGWVVRRERRGRTRTGPEAEWRDVTEAPAALSSEAFGAPPPVVPAPVPVAEVLDAPVVEGEHRAGG